MPVSRTYTPRLPFDCDAYIVTGRLDPVSPRMTMLVCSSYHTALRFCDTLSQTCRSSSYELWSDGELIMRTSGGIARSTHEVFLSDDAMNDALSTYLTYQIESVGGDLIDDTWWHPDLPAGLVGRAARGSAYQPEQHAVAPMSDRDRALRKAGKPWQPTPTQTPLFDHTGAAAWRRTNNL